MAVAEPAPEAPQDELAILVERAHAHLRSARAESATIAVEWPAPEERTGISALAQEHIDAALPLARDAIEGVRQSLAEDDPPRSDARTRTLLQTLGHLYVFVGEDGSALEVWSELARAYPDSDEVHASQYDMSHAMQRHMRDGMDCEIVGAWASGGQYMIPPLAEIPIPAPCLPHGVRPPTTY